MENRISGVILAGGANKRFGGIPKANFVFGGKTIISRMISIINEFFDEKIIVTNSRENFGYIVNCITVEDIYLKAGPIGGIHAGLMTASEDAIFVFAGDMPFLDKRIIKDQIAEFSGSKYDALIPKIGQFIEPLHAIYRKSVLKDLEMFISYGRSRAVKDFLTEIDVGYLQMPETEECKLAFTNINSPSDINKYGL